MQIKYSFVIACAPERKCEVLASLSNINYSKEKFEVIVKHGLNPSKNRNDGVVEAKGEIIGLIDDDAIVDENILKQIDEFFNKYPQISIVGGPQLTPKDDSFFGSVTFVNDF